jgi:3-oxoacyl-[acyl-carrier protein] reductase
MTGSEDAAVAAMLADRAIAGMVAIVTGAAHGMGKATAGLFAAMGATVAVIDRDGPGAEAVVAAIVARGGSAGSWVLDLSRRDDIPAVIAAIAGRFGRLDIVVNNAGIGRFARLDDERYDDIWDLTIAINLAAYQRVVRAALPWLRQAPEPRIVNIASVEGLGASAELSAYSASKGGVVALTRAMAVELGPDRITANCICPGPIETDMTRFFTPEMRDNFGRRRTALGRFGLAIEVAQTSLNLCLPASRYVTGAVIPVDGGMMARNT